METDTMPTSPFEDELPAEEQEMPESPFEDEAEPEPEEPEEEDESKGNEPEDEEEELTDEELDEILKELEEEEGEEEESVVPHAALHKERERRKAVQAQLQQTQLMLQEASQTNEEYRSAFEKLVKQLEDLGIKDMVNIETPKDLTPEARQLRMQQQAMMEQQALEQTVNTLRQEALAHIDEFPAIDPNDTEVGELLLGYSLAAMYFGADPEEAVLKGMSVINKRIQAREKQARRKITAPRTPRKRQSSKVARAQKQGNPKGVFDALAEQMLGE